MATMQSAAIAVDPTRAHIQQQRVTDFVRLVAYRVRASTKGFPTTGPRLSGLTDRWPHSVDLAAVVKAAVSAGTTEAGSWGAELTLSQAFVGYSNPFTLIGRMQNLRRVPFNRHVSRQTAALGFGWVGQAAPKPLTSAMFDRTTLQSAKIAGLVVVTDELLELASPAEETFLRDEMRDGLVAFMDQTFVDPAVAGVPGSSPSSITNGVTPIASTGDAREDLKALVSEFIANGGSLENAVLLISSTNAVGLSLASADIDTDLTVNGGTVAGLPVLASDAVGDIIVLADQRGIMVADDGNVNFRSSNAASLQMRTDPLSEATETVSLFQTNSVALLAERAINWAVADGAVAYVDGANYLAATSP